MKLLTFVISRQVPHTYSRKTFFQKQLTMRQFFTFLLVFGLFSPVLAQNNFWKPVKPESIPLPATAERRIQPLKSNTFQLDYSGLKTSLSEAPMEFTTAARHEPVVLQLPLADGSFQTFRVWESPVMAPELAAKFPAIRTYAGDAADGSGLTVRLGVDYKGFHAFIFNQDGGVQSVRPYAEGTDEYYMTYRMEDLPDFDKNGRCGVEDGHLTGELPDISQSGTVDERGNALVTLRKYRLAVVTQGEYSQFHGGTKPLVMSAIVTAVNFIVAIQERDWAVRLELIPNNDTLIFFDPATDPFTGPLVTDWVGDNPGAINPRVGVNSYDIGHLFARVVSSPGGVYVAGIAPGRVCNANKAVAGSSLPNPIGENYYVIIAHEMGHQFSASHTMNSCPPSSDNVWPPTAYEPGGGSTIMSYAGTCDPDIVEFNQQGYYHVASIEQAMSYITDGGGSGCAQAIVTDNNAPEVTIPLSDNFYIPISTPFVLTANATDADADNLTYCWEEYDLGPNTPLGQPILTAPAFRSFLPTSSPSRTFPRLSSIINNTQSSTEVLVDYSRVFNFKCTVRDNHPGAGGVATAAIKFNTTAQAGPFRVTFPNSNSDVWNVGEYQTITWDVANTDKALVNCKKVNILLSSNNGTSYPVVLAASVPNTGKYCIQVPDMPSNNSRIRVEAADNIFFDISNFGFKIQQPTQPDFSICPATFAELICAPTSFSTEISTAGIMGFNEPLTLSVAGLPAGATASFSQNPVQPGGTSTLTIDFSGTVPESSFDLTLEGAATAATKTTSINIRVVQNDFSALALQTPANGAQGVDLGPTLRWNTTPYALRYEVQVASNPSFEAGTIITSNANVSVDTFKLSILDEGQVCYWRVRPVNDCGAGDWTEPFVFVTKVQSCAPLAANDLPKPISANGTPTVESKITVTGSGFVVDDVNVQKVQGTHAFLQDLEVRLISPLGTNVLLFSNKCPGYSGNFNVGFDDSANGTFSCPPPQNGSYAKPTQLLSTFIGENAAGEWTLRVKDNVISSGGQLTGFELEFCSSLSPNPPFIVNNNTLQVMPGANAVIGDNLLKAEDANNGPGQLVFTLLTVPQYGDLRILGTLLSAGSQFTQSDISAGLLRYYEYGFNTGTDDFKFSVTDGEGGLLTGTFNIQPFPVGTDEPLGSIAFGLAPNPASDMMRLFVTEALDSDSRVHLFNTTGQLLRSWSLPAGAAMLLLDVADLPKGVYAVAVENEKGRGVKKVVVR